MTDTLFRLFSTALFSLAIASTPAFAQNRAMTKYRTNPPPSADLTYAIKARQQGIPVDGDALVRWTAGGNKFLITTETRAMLVGKILDAKSEGVIDDYGLAPVSFTEKRFRKEPTTTSFDRTSKTISFTGSAQTYPIKGGEQDRNSAIWQLISIARAAPAKFKPGSEWSFFVAGQRDGEPWTFKVVNQEKIRTQAGELNAVHILRAPPPDSKGQHLDIWLAPTLEWYPVRLRFSDSDGDFIEQTLKEANKKSS
jgi:hypothetical protein